MKGNKKLKINTNDKNLANNFNVYKKEGVLNYKFVFTDLLTNAVSQVIKPQTPSGSYGQISISLREIFVSLRTVKQPVMVWTMFYIKLLWALYRVRLLTRSRPMTPISVAF